MNIKIKLEISGNTKVVVCQEIQKTSKIKIEFMFAELMSFYYPKFGERHLFLAYKTPTDLNYLVITTDGSYFQATDQCHWDCREVENQNRSERRKQKAVYLMLIHKSLFCMYSVNANMQKICINSCRYINIKKKK